MKQCRECLNQYDEYEEGSTEFLCRECNEGMKQFHADLMLDAKKSED